jgi:hypothetical protein
VAVLAVFLASACAPGVYVRRLVPAPQNLGTARTLALVAVRGQLIGIEAVVLTELKHQVALRKHFVLTDALPLRLGINVPPRGQLAEVAVFRERLDAEYLLVATLTEFNQFSVPVVRSNETRHRAEGTARLAMDVVRAGDGKVVNRFELMGRAQGPDPWSKEAETNGQPNDMAQRATRDAVARFLGLITPRFVTEKIVFDDAEDLRPGIKLAEAEDFAGALKLWQDLVARVPTHAGASYNLAVVYEVQGEYEGAKQWYRRAIELAPKKELYLESERALFKRLEDAARLEQP